MYLCLWVDFLVWFVVVGVEVLVVVDECAHVGVVEDFGECVEEEFFDGGVVM